MSISLEGLATVGGNETRALATVKVQHNSQEYIWQVYIPVDANIETFIPSVEARVKAEIDVKEAEWAALSPKTRELVSPIGEILTAPIEKAEIVCPNIPDYYAKRRDAYPALGEQLDALWKGGQEAADMLTKIQAVKAKYPKPE